MIDSGRILAKLDELLNKNDYSGAERHLLYWLNEATALDNKRTKLLLQNELCGLYRKLGREADALSSVEAALSLIDEMGIEHNIGAGTTYLNAATVFKAFGRPEDAIPLFQKALAVYQNELPQTDRRFGGLYNNMALAFVDLKEFDKALAFYENAISVMKSTEDGMLEVAITYLNIANLKEAELGLEDAQEIIDTYLHKAEKILNEYENRNGYYAFVCEKCASVFGYYGYFAYENELKERAVAIYERS